MATVKIEFEPMLDGSIKIISSHKAFEKVEFFKQDEKIMARIYSAELATYEAFVCPSSDSPDFQEFTILGKMIWPG